MDEKERISVKAKELYPDYFTEEKNWGPCSYQPIIDSLGEVLIQIDDDDYSGDTRVLLHKDGKYGWVIFGWGSCSGCDSLQACDNHNDIQEIIDGLINDTEWFDSLDELKNRFRSMDWEGKHFWYSGETKKFKKEVLEYEKNNTN